MQMIRYCVPDKSAETVAFDEDMLADNKFSNSFFCQVPGCKANNVASGVVDGVFLSHVGCEALNPFWKPDTGRVEIPGGTDDGDYVKIGDMEIKHWEIGVLREICNSTYPGNKYRHMWFPLMLFRAMARPEGTRGFGSIVALVGGREVGKTILAMQAMDKQGYMRTGLNGRNVRIADYVFSRLLPGQTWSSNPWFDTLYLRHQLYDDLPYLFRPAGNLRVAGDLKAVFIEPSSRLDGNRTGSDHNTSQNISNGMKSKARRAVKSGFGLKSVVSFVKYFVAAASTFGPEEPAPNQAVQSPWHTVMFYDSAGEGADFNDSIIRNILRCADKKAILVNANEIFEPNVDEKTIRVAHARLNDLRNQGNNQNLCLVVTQLDNVLRRLGPDAEKIKTIAENLEDSDETRRHAELKEARALLRAWLRKKGYTTAKKQDFALDLVEFEEIFFLWTENLPPLNPAEFKEWLEKKTNAAVEAKPAQPGEPPAEAGKPRKARRRDSTQPESYGLAKFVCWCLDIKWSDINKER